MISNTVAIVNSAEQTLLTAEQIVLTAEQTLLTAEQTLLTADTKKKPVLKTIPKKIMGYLKFAHFVLGSNDDTIVSKLFLDKSIDQIVHIVNDVVENGNQDKTINDLRKLIFNPPKIKNHKKAKKADNADAIVTDLVTLARTDDTPNTLTLNPTQNPTQPLKKSRTKKVAETVVDTVAQNPTQSVKKSRTKKVSQTVEETVVTETVAETVVTETVAETVAQPVAHTVVETVAEPVAETVAETVAESVAQPVKKSRTKKIVEKKPTKTKAPMKSSDIAPSNELIDPNELSDDDSSHHL
jgi:hypothetical protein